MAIKTRWDQKTYRRHMFNRGRKVWSPHEASNTRKSTSEFNDEQSAQGHFWESLWRSPWAGKLDAAKEYEQYNNPESAKFSPFTFDSTERNRFREQDRKEVRKLFHEQLAGHHFAKHKKLSQAQLGKIVDAYMNQDDEKFKGTLAKMGITGKDADRWTRAAAESAETAIEGTPASTGWDDDKYGKPASQPDAKPTPTGSDPTAAGVGTGPGAAGAGPRNGTPQAPAGSTGGTRSDPIQPRTSSGTTPPGPSIGTANNRFTGQAGYSPSVVDGANVRTGNTSAHNNTDKMQAESTAAGAITAERARKDAQQGRRWDERDRAAADMEKSHGQNMRINEFNEKAEADRAKMVQERKDKRFTDRTLSNMDDWRNLGREGGNARNYAATADETPEQKAEREAALAVRNKTLAGLKDRLAQMSDATLVKKGEKYEWKDGKAVVTDAAGNPVDTAGRKTTGVGDDGLSYGNSFYANNPNRVKNLQAISKLVNEAGDNITDAQMEALTKKLDSWQKEADTRGANIAAMQKMRDAERTSGLRQKYGMADRNIYSDSDVTAYHDKMQKATRTDILKGMQVAPGLDAKSMGEGKGMASMRAFSEDWQKLLDNGFDPNKTLARALEDADTKKAYDEARFAVDREGGSDVADKRDQLQRRFIMQQAMKEHGLTGTGGETGVAGAQIAAKPGVEGIPGSGQTMAQAMAQNLPGRSILTPAGKTPYEIAKQEAQPALDAMPQEKPSHSLGGLVSDLISGKTQPPAGAQPPSPVLKKKPAEGSNAAMWAGDALLRPRRRS